MFAKPAEQPKVDVDINGLLVSPRQDIKEVFTVGKGVIEGQPIDGLSALRKTALGRRDCDGLPAIPPTVIARQTMNGMTFRHDVWLTRERCRKLHCGMKI